VHSTLSPNIWLIILQQLNITVYVISNNMIVFIILNIKYWPILWFLIPNINVQRQKCSNSVAFVVVDNHLSQRIMVVHLMVRQNWSCWKQHLHDLCTTVFTADIAESTKFERVADSKIKQKLKVYQYLILTKSRLSDGKCIVIVIYVIPCYHW